MTKNIDELTTAQISEYLKEREFKERQRRYEVQRKAEDLFIEQNKVSMYDASDYCGLTAGRYEFYYGYEVTEGDEWCFTAKVDGIQEMKLSTSKLYPARDENILWYLLSGIGQFLNTKMEA